MRRSAAAIGSGIFFLLAPGIVAGVVPWWITRWHIRGDGRTAAWIPLRVIGVALLVVSVPVLVRAFWQFASEGLGTPAPVAPTAKLVVGGLYRYVRNPMYLAVIGAIVGQALLLGQPLLLFYAGGILTAFVSFVRWYEEPTLTRQFGAEYETYRKAVPAWWPRRQPWRPKGK
jgi:protein-S-isoprenylcysteine O-methyltransferase Ste14